MEGKPDSFLVVTSDKHCKIIIHSLALLSRSVFLYDFIHFCVMFTHFPLSSSSHKHACLYLAGASRTHGKVLIFQNRITHFWGFGEDLDLLAVSHSTVPSTPQHLSPQPWYETTWYDDVSDDGTTLSAAGMSEWWFELIIQQTHSTTKWVQSSQSGKARRWKTLPNWNIQLDDDVNLRFEFIAKLLGSIFLEAFW